MPRPGAVVDAFGSGPVAVLAWNERRFADVQLRLHPHADVLDPALADEADAHRRRIAATPGGLNEMRFAPRSVSVRRLGSVDRCRLEGVMTDYAAWAAAARQWSMLAGDERLARCRQGLEGVVPHGIGVAAVVVCSDGAAILAQRAEASSWYPGHWAVTGEGASVGDLTIAVDGSPQWDPVVTGRRGVHEELAVASRETDWALFAVVVDVQSGSVSVLARACVPLTSAQVVEAWRGAQDRAEAATVAAVPWDAQAVTGWAARYAPLVPVDAGALVGALALDVGWGECVRQGWVTVSDGT